MRRENGKSNSATRKVRAHLWQFPRQLCWAPRKLYSRVACVFSGCWLPIVEYIDNQHAQGRCNYYCLCNKDTKTKKDATVTFLEEYKCMHCLKGQFSEFFDSMAKFEIRAQHSEQFYPQVTPLLLIIKWLLLGMFAHPSPRSHCHVYKFMQRLRRQGVPYSIWTKSIWTFTYLLVPIQPPFKEILISQHFLGIFAVSLLFFF